MSDCLVCSETISNSITCMFCNCITCSPCTEQYILTQPIAKCMSCNKEWDDYFMRSTFKTTWIKTKYKDHKKKMLLDQERSYLPESMPYVQSYKEASTLESKFKELTVSYDKQDMKIEIINLKCEISKLSRSYKDKPQKDKLKEKLKELQNKSKEIRNTKASAKQAKNTFNREAKVRQNQIQALPNVFLRQCISNDCRGFLNSNWTCGLCNIKVCKSCHCEDEEEHKCNQSDVESAKMIENETKPCPKCAARIYKTEGCDHMFCTACKTGFSWITGKLISNDVNTNPYFYRWQAERPQQIQYTGVENIACMEMSYRIINDILHHKNYIINNDTISFLTSVQSVYRDARRKVNDNPTTSYNPIYNREARVKYLAGDFTEKQLASEAMKTYKRYEYNVQLNQICTTLSESVQDWMKRLYIWIEGLQNGISNNDFQTLGKELLSISEKWSEYKNIVEVVSYFNKNMKELTERFNYSSYFIFEIKKNYFVFSNKSIISENLIEKVKLTNDTSTVRQWIKEGETKKIESLLDATELYPQMIYSACHYNRFSLLDTILKYNSNIQLGDFDCVGVCIKKKHDNILNFLVSNYKKLLDEDDIERANEYLESVNV